MEDGTAGRRQCILEDEIGGGEAVYLGRWNKGRKKLI